MPLLAFHIHVEGAVHAERKFLTDLLLGTDLGKMRVAFTWALDVDVFFFSWETGGKPVLSARRDRQKSDRHTGCRGGEPLRRVSFVTEKKTNKRTEEGKQCAWLGRIRERP